MNILIVDDNANNRMVLRLLLEDYGEEQGQVYLVDECTNGLEAVEAARSKKFDLIFMDIMMPEMDGIEATKQIRGFDKDVMIITVSAVDDEDRQKEILRNGAEDYISKPIDAKQLNSRLDSYMALLSRRHIPKQTNHSKSVNLFSKDIFHRQTIFYVEHEEALSEFWEYYLLSDESSKVDNLSDVVRVIFSLGDAIVKSGARPWIIVEEDTQTFYFTINELALIGADMVQTIIYKNDGITEFISNDEKISFKLHKHFGTLEPMNEQTKIEVKEDTAIDVPPVQSSVEITRTNTDEYQVFNYMDPDDLMETEELLGSLSSLMLMLGSSVVEPEDVVDISFYLEKMGKGLSIYNESYQIGQALIELSQSIADHTDRFQEIAGDLSTLSAAFVADLQSWVDLTFYKGAPSVDFMDDTIIANTQTIAAMLGSENTDVSDEAMDDIFDF